jgi:hypothetical protein
MPHPRGLGEFFENSQVSVMLVLIEQTYSVDDYVRAPGVLEYLPQTVLAGVVYPSVTAIRIPRRALRM